MCEIKGCAESPRSEYETSFVPRPRSRRSGGEWPGDEAKLERTIESHSTLHLTNYLLLCTISAGSLSLMMT